MFILPVFLFASGFSRSPVFPGNKKTPGTETGQTRFCPRRDHGSVQPDQSCFCALTLTPGPMVDAVTQVRMYWPLAVAGLALMMAPMRAV